MQIILTILMICMCMLIESIFSKPIEIDVFDQSLYDDLNDDHVQLIQLEDEINYSVFNLFVPVIYPNTFNEMKYRMNKKNDHIMNEIPN